MSKTNTVGMWMLVAIVSAAIINPNPTGTADAAHPPLSAVAPTAAATSSPRHQGSDDEIDTLQTIGESLSLDLSTAGLRRRAARNLEQLKRVDGDPAALENAARFFTTFLELPIRDCKELLTARDAIRGLRGNTSDGATVAAAAKSVDAFLSRYFDRYPLTDSKANKEDVLLARDFDEIDKSTLQLAILRNAAQERKIDIRFLIATLPDPVDSFTGWQFDPMLDAIGQAVGASDYMLDRFHFPDSDKEDKSDTTATRGRLHELEPGVIIFKKHDGTDGHPTENTSSESSPKSGDQTAWDRLVLLIVHENPAAGIHSRALVNAIGLVIQSRELTGDIDFERGVTILGPTFSGSGETLNRALRIVSTRYRADCAKIRGGKCRVRILSGSATDRQNKETIESSLGRTDVAGSRDSTGPALEVTFQATVNPDDVMLPFLAAKISEAQWSTRVAVLCEANTQYGRQLWEILSTVKSPSGKHEFSFIQLPFPINVSQIRTTLETQNPTRPGMFGLPSRFRPISMESEGNPADQIPRFNPNTTATYMELALAGALKTMQREGLKTVGLMATDPRDKLFLAQQIAQYSPDVSIFTVESDSVYVHPDYSPYLRGALVVSTYPLYSANQRWSYAYKGDSERRQFANGSAQGIYNAALALLNYDENGDAITEKAPRLLEYGMPGEQCALCTPPVWISVIGQLGAWPVRAYLPKNESDVGAAAMADASCAQAAGRGTNNLCNYVFAVKVHNPSNSTVRSDLTAPRLTIYPSSRFNALLIFMTSAIVLFWGVQGRTVGGLRRASPDIESGASAYLVVCLLGVVLMLGFTWVLCLLLVIVERWSVSSGVMLVIASIGLIAATHMTWRVGGIVVRDYGLVIRRALKEGSPAAIGGFAAVVVCLWGVVNIAVYLKDQVLQGLVVREWGDTISFLSRALDLGNGVSPTVPVLFLGSAATFWSVIELWRVRRGHVALPDADVQSLLQKAVYTDVKAITSSWELLNQSMLRVPRSGVVIAVLGLLASCTFAFDPIRSWLVSTEGPWFGRFVSAGLLLLQVMVTLALVQFAFVWSRIRRLLGFMTYHELADAYERVPREVCPVMIFPRPPRLADLKIPVAHCAGLANASSAAEAHVVGAPSELSDVERTFRQEMRETPDMPWASSKTWITLLNGALQAESGLNRNRMLGSEARMRIARMEPSNAGADVIAMAVAEIVAADRALQQREADLPAMLIAFVLRDALARLAVNLIFVIGGVVLGFCAHTLFPFQQHTNLQVLAWIYIAGTFTTIVTVLAQIKRNEIVSRLTSPTPGVRTTWDSGFVLKVAVYALLPLLTLFAAQFPDVGAVLMRWLEPIKSALP